MKTILRSRWLAAVMSVVALAGALGTAQAGTFVPFVHPEAALQSTAQGKKLHTLHVAGGKVYVGYGDYGANTGPINVRYYDPAASGGAGAFSSVLVTADTDAIMRFHTGPDDKVYALYTDPVGRISGAYASGQAGASSGWSKETSTYGLHFFDMTTYAPTGQLFMAGSGGPTHDLNGIVYSSSDNGATWQSSLDIAPPEPYGYPTDGDDTHGFYRFYGVGQLNNKLYVQPVHSRYNVVNGSSVFQSSYADHLWIYDGTSWSAGPLMRTATGGSIAFYEPETFAGTMVSRAGHTGNANNIYTFDGTSLAVILQPRVTSGNALYFDQQIVGDTMYVLRDDGVVASTTDLINWTHLVTGVPSDARSLAVLDNTLYLGALNGVLYEYDTLIPEPGALMVIGVAGLLMLRRRARLR